MTYGACLHKKVTSGFLPCVVFLMLTLFYFYENILRIVPTLITHHLTTGYHLNAKSLSILVAAFYLIYAPMQLVVGIILDRYGSRRSLTVAVIFCAIGSAMFGWGESYYVLFISRLFIGFGAAFAFVSTLNILARITENRHFGVLTGAVIAVGVLGTIFGHMVLTHVIRDVTWQMACYLFAGFGAILAFIVWLVLSAKTTNMIEMRFEQPVSFSCGFAQELRTLLANRQFWINALIASFFYMPILGFTTTWQSNYLQQVRYFDYDTASNSLLVVFIGWGIGAPFFGWLSQKLKQERVLISLAATVTTILLAMIIYKPHVSVFFMHVLLFLFGFSSSVHAVNFLIVKRLTSRRLFATGVALTNMIIMIGSVALCVLGVLLDWVWQGEFVRELPKYSEVNFQTAFIILLIASFLALVLSFFLKESNE